jgi:hypothetical protein
VSAPVWCMASFPLSSQAPPEARQAGEIARSAWRIGPARRLTTCARFLAMTTILHILSVPFFAAAIISLYSRRHSRLSFPLLIASVICATY